MERLLKIGVEIMSFLAVILATLWVGSKEIEKFIDDVRGDDEFER